MWKIAGFVFSVILSLTSWAVPPHIQNTELYEQTLNRYGFCWKNPSELSIRFLQYLE